MFTVEAAAEISRAKLKEEALEAQGFGPGEKGSGLFAERKTKRQVIEEQKLKDEELAEQARTILQSEDAKNFILLYQNQGLDRLSNSQIMREFIGQYKGKIPSASKFKDILAEEIRKALTKTNTKEE